MKTKFMIVLFLILFSYVYPYKYEKQEKKSFTLGENERVKLTNINGIIKLTNNQDKQVVIKAVKMADKKEDLDAVKTEFEYKENFLNIYTKINQKNYKVIVNFYISVPENTKFIQLSSTNGRIEATGNFKNLIFKTINGEIEFKGSISKGNFKSINGSTYLYLKDALRGNIDAVTVNGSVKMELKDEFSFSIDGTSVNGYIKSDFNLPIKKDFVSSKIKGSVNQGKHKIFIKTSNGSIKLLKI
jgi:DUF4097 and DUF4098 domain-containing protein YvlB